MNLSRRNIPVRLSLDQRGLNSIAFRVLMQIGCGFVHPKIYRNKPPKSKHSHTPSGLTSRYCYHKQSHILDLMS